MILWKISYQKDLTHFTNTDSKIQQSNSHKQNTAVKIPQVKYSSQNPTSNELKKNYISAVYPLNLLSSRLFLANQWNTETKI